MLSLSRHPVQHRVTTAARFPLKPAFRRPFSTSPVCMRPTGPQQDQPYQYKPSPPPPETWLTTYLKGSPRAMGVFQSFTSAIGVNNPKQLAGRHCLSVFQNACSTRQVAEHDFWHEECRLPPTFQSWFTITNLHVWMLTVRFRALPAPHGTYYVQGLVDHFFIDVEDRIRQVVSKKAPERLVTRQMKILREQWAGLGLSFDYALSLSCPNTPSEQRDGDVEMAAAVWRNLLGARGARGIDDPGPGKIRRALNLTGEVDTPKVPPALLEERLAALEQTDDGSGVHDFSGADTQLYVHYPDLMATIVAYVRRELARLEAVADEQILAGLGTGEFGRIRIGGEVGLPEGAQTLAHQGSVAHAATV